MKKLIVLLFAIFPLLAFAQGNCHLVDEICQRARQLAGDGDFDTALTGLDRARADDELRACPGFSKITDLIKELEATKKEVEKERLAREKAEKEKLAHEKAEKERAAREKERKEKIIRLNNLGRDYFLGKNGKKQDYSEALKCYQQTAEMGDTTGMINFACCCYKTSPSYKRDSRAREYFAKASKSRNPAARNNMGVVEYNAFVQGGSSSLTQLKEVLTWFIMAANQGDVWAMYNIGYIFFNNYKVKDYDKAREWYSKAAEKGFPPAQRQMSVMLRYGWGGKKDKKQAESLKKKADAQGDAYLEESPFHLFIY